MNTPIRDSAIAYAEVLRHIQTLTIHIAQPITEIYQAVRAHPKVRGAQQVMDAVKSLHAKGLISRVREGRSYAYWAGAKGLSAKTCDNELPKPEVIKALQPAVIKPEITVTETSIIINHAKCKITIEF